MRGRTFCHRGHRDDTEFWEDGIVLGGVLGIGGRGWMEVRRSAVRDWRERWGEC